MEASGSFQAVFLNLFRRIRGEITMVVLIFIATVFAATTIASAYMLAGPRNAVQPVRKNTGKWPAAPKALHMGEYHIDVRKD
jgi:hypothetical protein